MAVNIFIGDSHTSGYVGIVSDNENENCLAWQDNNYAKIYGEITGQKSVIYAHPGANHDAYANWLKFLLDKYNDVNNVFICLRGFNRFTIAGWHTPITEPLPVDHFTIQEISEDLCDCYRDLTVVDGFFQEYQKTIPQDYDKYVQIKFDQAKGLLAPDLRKNTFMEVKTFMELNTHLEIQNFLKNVFIWDNLCRIKNVTLHIFCIKNQVILPNAIEYYSSFTNTKVANTTVEDFFAMKNIDHKKYLLNDYEHYNYEYHKLIAEKYIRHIL